MQHTAFTELFERVRGGLLWVQADGSIRHASADARRRTALRAGDVLDDAALRRAVQFAARGGQSRSTLYTDGEVLIACRVIPGFDAGDAFVLFAEEPRPDAAAESSEVVLRAADRSLREPLAQAQEALALWCDDGDPHAQATLAAEVETLLGRVERLCDLGRLWSGEDEPAEERLELWPLLQQAWSQVEPQAIDKRVGLRFRCVGDRAALVALYGQKPWLLRALVECLSAAVAATPDDAQLLVEQRQIGTRAVLRFRQRAMFADAPAHGADVITLTLCRQVLALHGGTLAPDPIEGDWVLELPTGAPVQATAPELGIAQAQVYARDLAALMNRSRRQLESAS